MKGNRKKLPITTNKIRLLVIAFTFIGSTFTENQHGYICIHKPDYLHS